METRIAPFKGKDIRKTLHDNEWWFSVVDVCAALADTPDEEAYWRKLKRRLKQESPEAATFCRALKVPAPDGQLLKTDCANTEGIFRIIQSINSPKAEPFKRALAKVGLERLLELEDPELAMRRTHEIYKAKGYSDQWIEKRLRGIAIHGELIEEWKKREVNEPECATLTSEINKATFGLTSREHKRLKGLQRENLRDHMTDLELIFSMLGEASTKEIARTQDARGFEENQVAAYKGGRISAEAREKLEAEISKSVVTPQNFLVEPENRKRIS